MSKRVKLTHGTARVDKNCSKETLKALDKMSKLAYKTDNNNFYCESEANNGKRCLEECKCCSQLLSMFKK